MDHSRALMEDRRQQASSPQAFRVAQHRVMHYLVDEVLSVPNERVIVLAQVGALPVEVQRGGVGQATPTEPPFAWMPARPTDD